MSYIDDVDLESTSNNLKTQRLLGRADKILDSVGINDSSASSKSDSYSSSYQKRALKVGFLIVLLTRKKALEIW